MEKLAYIPSDPGEYRARLLDGARLMMDQARRGRAMLGEKYEDYRNSESKEPA